LGVNHSVFEAVDAVNKDDTKIKLDTEKGKNHHRRVHRVLRLVGCWSPWVEAAGFLAFVTYYLDVPLLQPRREDDGNFTGEIGTGIPGARTVDLLPLFDRVDRLEALKEQRAKLQERTW
jgi:hypothetical protein